MAIVVELGADDEIILKCDSCNERVVYARQQEYVFKSIPIMTSSGTSPGITQKLPQEPPPKEPDEPFIPKIAITESIDHVIRNYKLGKAHADKLRSLNGLVAKELRTSGLGKKLPSEFMLQMPMRGWKKGGV